MKIQRRNSQSRLPAKFCNISRRHICGVLLLIFYTACIISYFSVGGYLKQSLLEEHRRNRPLSYIEQQLEAFDRPKENNKHEINIIDDLADIRKPKPRLFLHVGPQKTGSSSIQSMLDKLSQLTGTLKGDNLNYKHITPEEGDFDCELDQYGGWHNCVASEQLKNLIDTSRAEGRSLLLTDENLDANFAQGLRDAISDDDWDVTVIVMYRRIHEWLVSWYNQIQKTTNVDSNGNVLFDENGIPYRTEHTQWPDAGGVHIPTFASWYQDYTRYWETSQLPDKHRSIEYYNLYRELFDYVIFYNMHQEGSVAEDFLCNILEADVNCERLRNKEITLRTVNGSVNLDLDILAVHAYEKGLIHKSATRQQVVEAIANRIQETGANLPRVCDSQMNKEILDWLIETEKIMVGPTDWCDTDAVDLMQLYNSFLATGKLCSVDADAVLADEEWSRFFKSFGTKGNLVLHVGPMGGTAIHKTLSTLPDLRKALAEDDYAIFDYDGSGVFQSTISSLDGTGKNILISSDHLDEDFAKTLKQVVNRNRWDVMIVVGYIRLNESLLAMYENLYDSRDLTTNEEKLYSQWPDQGGIPTLTFQQWLNEYFTKESETINLKELLGGHLRDAFVSSYEDVEYLAYHEGDDLLVTTNFLCQILPGATNSCAAAKKQSPPTEPQLESIIDADADHIAILAHDGGLVDGHVSRAKLRDAIHLKLASKAEASRICDSSETKQFYDWMIQSEKDMMGDRFSSKRIAPINQEFQSLLESGKLCPLDLEAELADESWVTFFRDYQ